MEKQIHTVGERVEKLCAQCGEQHAHIVASVTKSGKISRVICGECGVKSTFKTSDGGLSSTQRQPMKAGEPYDRTRTYHNGQTMEHPVFGQGKVTAVVEPQMIDVLFSDRLRRLIHARN